MAWYYQQHGISALGVTLFAGKETGENLDRVPLEYVENAIAWLKEQGFEKIAVDGISKGRNTPFWQHRDLTTSAA